MKTIKEIKETIHSKYVYHFGLLGVTIQLWIEDNIR